MKTIQCQHCNTDFSGEDKTEILKELHAHYLQDHHAIISNVDEAGKKAWMERFNSDWDNA